MFDWNLKASFDATYSIGAEGRWGHPSTRREVKLGYVRAVMLPHCETRADGVIAALGWTPPGPRGVIMGAGFGWLVECLERRGMTELVGVDPSDYIQAEKDRTDEPEIDQAIRRVGLDPDAGDGAVVKGRLFDGGVRVRTSRGMLDEGSRDVVRSHLAGPVEVILSEFVIDSFEDEDARVWSEQLHRLAPRVVHLVQTPQPRQDPNFNWKTVADWKRLIPSDGFMDGSSFELI